MAFKIRRGTDAERLTITPAQGELIYTTDTKKLYIGDGNTVGGIAVIQGLASTSYVDSAINNLVDGSITTLNTLKELANALGNNPNFANDLVGSLAGKADTSTVQALQTSKADISSLSTVATSGNYNDLSNKPAIPSISGLATETFVNNKVADLINNAPATLNTLNELAQALGNDQNFSTTIINSLSNKANTSSLSVVATSGSYSDLSNKPTIPDLSSIAQNILPDNDITRDIGSSTKRFRDLYLSSNTLYLGEKSMTIDANNNIEISSEPLGGEGVAGISSIEWTTDDELLIRISVGSIFEDLLDNLVIGNKFKILTPITATITVTGPAQGTIFAPNPTFKDYVIPVDSSPNLSNQFVYTFQLVNPITRPDTNSIPDPDNLLPSKSNAGWPEYDNLGINTLRGDQSLFIRPSWNRTPTVDFEFKSDGKLKLPAGGDIVNSSGNSVLSNSPDIVRVKPVPSSTTGDNSDLKGHIAVDSDKLYVAYRDYNGQAVYPNVGIALLTGSNYLYLNKDGWPGPQVGWSVKYNPTNQTSTVVAVDDLGTRWGVTCGNEFSSLFLNDNNATFTFTKPADVIWKNIPFTSTANTGNITFNGDTIGSTNNIVDISVSDYAQLNSNDSFVWVDNNGAHVEVNGGEGGREFVFGSDGRSLRAQISMPQGAKLNFGADATALGGPDSSGSTDKIRLWDFQGSNPSGYNYAIGAEGGGIWFSTDVNNGTGGFSFYSQNNRKFKIRDDGTVDLYNHILPDDNNIIDLGSENTKFRNVYAAGVTNSHKRATSCPVNVDTVVYTATGQYQHAIKLFAMVEGNVDGEGSNWHTQACDIIAVRGYNNNTVFVTTYGVTYTSTAAFATFDAQWNATSNRIEITCRPVSTNNNVVVSIHAIEITSQD